MKEELIKHLKLRGYKLVIYDDRLLIKSIEGNLLIENISTTPRITKKNNVNNFSTVTGLLFFLVVIIIDREEVSNNILYSLFVVLFSLYLLYNRIVLEINKHKVYGIIDKINANL